MAQNMAQKVLITGMSGLIGSALRKQMEGKYQLSALNRSALEGVECHRADISDLEAIRPAFQGKDTVVHLAAHVSVPGEFEDMLKYNVIGAYNVFEAAREAGVKRVVFASTGATIAGVERHEPYKSLAEARYGEATPGWPMIDHNSPVQPRGLYGCSKVWGEALARHYSDSSDLSVICVRIGRVTAEDRPMAPREKAVWCSQRDIATLLEACVAAPADLKFDIVFGVSNNKYSYRDMEHAREVLGFVPRDSAEDFD